MPLSKNKLVNINRKREVIRCYQSDYFCGHQSMDTKVEYHARVSICAIQSELNKSSLKPYRLWNAELFTHGVTRHELGSHFVASPQVGHYLHKPWISIKEKSKTDNVWGSYRLWSFANMPLKRLRFSLGGLGDFEWGCKSEFCKD